MYRLNKDFIAQKIDKKQTIVFDVERSILFTFNETAGFIFKKIKLGWEEEKIVIALAKKYDVTLPTLKKDIKTIIKDMVKNKIIVPTRSK